MKRATCYIIAAGEHYSAPSEPDSGDMVIAADGGYDYLCGFNIKPDLIIGDFDSLGLVPSGSSVIKLPAVKDNTDTEAAIEEGSADTSALSSTAAREDEWTTPWPISSV